MNFQDRGNIITLVVAILSLVKISTDLAGYDLGLDNNKINEIANHVAIIGLAVGVIFNNHFKSTSFKKDR